MTPKARLPCGLVRMDGHTYVGRRQDRENVCLQERNQRLERIHEEEQEEPGNSWNTNDQIHAEDSGLQEDGGCQRENGEDHMTCQHIAIKTDGQRKNANDHRNEL